MNPTLIKTLIALTPTCVVFLGSVILFSRARTLSTFLQVLGAGCLVLVVLTYVAEVLHWFRWMHWGREHSVGHYVDLWSAVLGVTLFPLGYFLHAIRVAGK
jgi:hypothetical protein